MGQVVGSWQAVGTLIGQRILFMKACGESEHVVFTRAHCGTGEKYQW